MAAEGALKAPFRMLMGTGEILCLDPVSFHFIQFNEGAVSFLVEPGDIGPVPVPYGVTGIFYILSLLLYCMGNLREGVVSTEQIHLK